MCARTFKDDRALRQHAATCARKQRRIKIHYVHGLEAGPNAFKARCLAKLGDVTSPAMATSLWNPFCENAFLGRFLAHLSWGAAARDVLDRCVAIQKDALAEPDVLVASSWGAAVALKLLVDRAWTGPTVLLCPRPPAAPLLSRRRRARDRVPGAAEEDLETRRPGPRHGRRHRAHWKTRANSLPIGRGWSRSPAARTASAPRRRTASFRLWCLTRSRRSMGLSEWGRFFCWMSCKNVILIFISGRVSPSSSGGAARNEFALFFPIWYRARARS